MPVSLRVDYLCPRFRHRISEGQRIGTRPNTDSGAKRNRRNRRASASATAKPVVIVEVTRRK
jgi:hypothetical protein